MNLTSQKFEHPGGQELKTLRRENSKTFGTKTGSYTAVVSAGPLHWKGPNGWNEYKFQPKSKRHSWEVDAGLPYKVSLPRHGVGFTFSAGQNSYSAKLVYMDGPLPDVTCYPQANGFRWDVVDGFSLFLNFDEQGIEFFKLVEGPDTPRELRWEITNKGADTSGIARTINPRTILDALDSDGNIFDVTSTVESIEDNSWILTEVYPHRVSRVVDPKTRQKRWHDDPAYPVIVDAPAVTFEPTFPYSGILKDIDRGYAKPVPATPWPPGSSSDEYGWDPGVVSSSSTQPGSIMNSLYQYASTYTSTKSFASWMKRSQNLINLFQDIPIPTGSRVSSATLFAAFDQYTEVGTPPPLAIRAIASDTDNAPWDPALGSTASSLPDAAGTAWPHNWLNRITASDIKTITSISSYNSVVDWDVTSLLDQILARAGWLPNNDIRMGLVVPSERASDIAWETTSTEWAARARLASPPWLSIEYEVSWSQILLFRNANDLPDLQGWSLEGDETMREYQADYLHLNDQVIGTGSSATCQFYRTTSMAASAGTMTAVVRVEDDTAYGTSNSLFMQIAGAGSLARVSIMKNGVVMYGETGYRYIETDMQTEEHEVSLVAEYEAGSVYFYLYVDGEFVAEGYGVPSELEEFRFGCGSDSRTSESFWHSLKWSDDAPIIPVPTATLVSGHWVSAVSDGDASAYWPMDGPEDIHTADYEVGIIQNTAGLDHIFGNMDLKFADFSAVVQDASGTVDEAYSPTTPVGVGLGLVLPSPTQYISSSIAEYTTPALDLGSAPILVEQIIDNGQMTFEMWTLIDSTDPGWGTEYTSFDIWGIKSQSGNTTSFLCTYSTTSGMLTLLAKVGVVTATLSYDYSLLVDEWHLLDFVWDGADLTLYIDGVSAATTSLVGTFSFGSDTGTFLYMGGAPGIGIRSGQSMPGAIARASIFSEATGTSGMLERVALRNIDERSGHDDHRWDATAYALDSTEKIGFDWFDFMETASVTVRIAQTEDITFLDGRMEEISEGTSDLTLSAEGADGGISIDEAELIAWSQTNANAAAMTITPVGHLEITIEPVDPPDRFLMLKRRSIIMKDVDYLDSRGYPKVS